MANKTVSNLNELTTVSNSDVLLVETATETHKVTKGNLLKEVIEQLNAKSNASHTHDEYVTENELNNKGLATETFVINKIADAQLVGGNSVYMSPLKDKKWLAIGDSITALTNHSAKNYHTFISERTGCVVNNFGMDGWTIARFVSENKIAEMPSDVDFVTVLLGTNDWHIGKLPLGNFLDTTSQSVAGALNLFFQQLIEKYGNRTILVFTPLQRNGYGGNQSGLNAGNNSSNGFSLLNLVDMIIKTCSHYGIPCKDLYRESGFHMQFDACKTLYFTDGLHPNLKGHEALSYIMLPFIEGNYNPSYAAFPTIPDAINIVLSTNTLEFTNGNSTEFTVSLDKTPENNQVISITSNGCTTNPSELTFTATNYSTPQTVTVSSNTAGNGTIILSSQNINSATINVSITDVSQPSNQYKLKMSVYGNVVVDDANQTVSVTDAPGVSNNFGCKSLSELADGNYSLIIELLEKNFYGGDVTVIAESVGMCFNSTESLSTLQTWINSANVGDTKTYTGTINDWSSNKHLFLWYCSSGTGSTFKLKISLIDA